MDYFNLPNVDKKIFDLPEEAVEIMKHMNPQQLVNTRRRLACEDFEWKCFWKLNKYFCHMQIQACLYKCKEQKYFMWKVTEIFKP